MILASDYQPEYESFRERLLELGQIRSVDELLKRVVVRLAERPHVALARIWLIERCEECGNCSMLESCSDHTACLLLKAGSGKPMDERNKDWNRTEGDFRRIPLGIGPLGRMGIEGKPWVVSNLAEESDLSQFPDWIRSEHIQGINVQPVIFKDQILGVLGVYTRIPTPELGPPWLRILADYMAVILAQARAFEENDHLRWQLELENTYLREELDEAKAFGKIIGRSSGFRKLLHQLKMVAPTDASVLIQGESGTGKELVAREIHHLSRRSEEAMIRVNCASVPRELYESEFFGHVKGSFTGAIKDRAGRFEAADGGTLFLDEVGEIPLELQSKFLRVLQEKQYERVGDERTRSVDVRIIAATNRDLKKEVEEGRFRQDLYYRLNVFPIQVPPLRARIHDIPLLAINFVEQTTRHLKLAQVPSLSRENLAQLKAYYWPGNVRELQNVIERAVILSQGGELHFDLPAANIPTVDDPLAAPFSEPGNVLASAPPAPATESSAVLTEEQMSQFERTNLIAAMTKAKWKVHGPGGAAEILAVKPTTLISRLKKLGITKS